MIVFLLLGFVGNSPIPDLPTIDSCTNRQITITDRNIRMAIHFFRGCRNLGLTMGDLLPEDYMKNLGNLLKTANYQFLRQTNISQPKLKMLEKEINDLYQEVIILSEKMYLVRKPVTPLYITTTICPTTTQATTTTCPTTSPPSQTMTMPLEYECTGQEDSNSKSVDLFDYDYSQGASSSEEGSCYGYLLIGLALVTFVICLWTWAIARKTYKLLKAFQQEDDAPSVEK